MAVTRLAVSGVTASSFNRSAATTAIAAVTGANTTAITVTVQEHELNASIYLFYIASPTLLTYDIQAALRRSVLGNITTVVGALGDPTQLVLTLDAITVITAEEAAQEVAMAQSPSTRRRLAQYTSDSSGGGAAGLAPAPAPSYVLKVPLSLTGFGANTAFAVAASAQLNYLLDSDWLDGVLVAQFARNGVQLDSISGNEPLTSALLGVEIVAASAAAAARLSTSLTLATTDNLLTSALSGQLGTNITLQSRSPAVVKLPRFLRLDEDVKELEVDLSGGPLAGVILGTIISAIVMLLLCCVIFVYRSRLAALHTGPADEQASPNKRGRDGLLGARHKVPSPKMDDTPLSYRYAEEEYATPASESASARAGGAYFAGARYDEAEESDWQQLMAATQAHQPAFVPAGEPAFEPGFELEDEPAPAPAKKPKRRRRRVPVEAPAEADTDVEMGGCGSDEAQTPTMRDVPFADEPPPAPSVAAAYEAPPPRRAARVEAAATPAAAPPAAPVAAPRQAAPLAAPTSPTAPGPAPPRKLSQAEADAEFEARAAALARRMHSSSELLRTRPDVAEAEAAALRARARAAEAERRAARTELAVREATAATALARQQAEQQRAAQADFAQRLSTAEAALGPPAPSWGV
jgi:hypothetical protein